MQLQKKDAFLSRERTGMKTCKWRIKIDVSDNQDELPGFIGVSDFWKCWLLWNFFRLLEPLPGILLHGFALDMLKWFIC